MSNLAVQELADRQARADALDIGGSVLVQAPAGSGKTELLAMRFLKLLALVEEPEQVLGITFTKAATAEIRHRILGKLEMARDLLETGTAPDKKDAASLEIATRAYTNSNARGWKLLEQPHRLNIETIDSLSLRIAHQMPLSGRPGGVLQPTEAATPLYRRAAQKTLDQLGGDDEELNAALRGLLLLRDGNLAGCEALIAKMLATRDQWSRAFPLTGEIDWPAVRQRLEEPFHREIERVLGEMHDLLSSHHALTQDLLRLADFACGNDEELEIEISLLAGMKSLPSPSLAFVEHWRCFAQFLLTKKDLRKRHDVSNGFPRGAKAEKAQMRDLARGLSGIHGFVDLLLALRGLPQPSYSDKEWASLCQIIIVLRHAVKELRTNFVEQGAVDFVEVGIAALEVLRNDTQGIGIQHLLVDEFQDTSRSQHQVIAALLRSWDADSSNNRRTLFDAPRTVFLVGDPMQSIYMFRQADVELFTQVRDHGLATGAGQLSVRALDLKTNFRSHAGLVNQLNTIFAIIFPHGVKHGSADVSFLPATPGNETIPAGAYQIHADFMTSEKASRDGAQQRETEEILKIIRRHQPRINEARDQGEEFTVAILARAKNHLVPLAAALRDKQIPFRAVDLEQLGERQEVLDLQSLTRALLHPMDRIAWLAMLRAPWCGLELRDLHLLCGTDPRPSDPSAVQAQLRERLLLLDDDPRERASRVIAVMQAAVGNRHRQSSFSSWIERTWNSLGGPACVDAAGYENAQAYFRMLEEVSLDGIDATGEAMRDRLARLYAKSDPSVSDRCGVQLMTMHKAKGLGFNVVVLPGLNKPTSRDPFTLIRYAERSTGLKTELLVAPIGNKGEKPSSTYLWVGRQKQNREAEERKRLLYVACTRAREELHLFATVTVTDKGTNPVSGSLLHTAWPALESVFDAEYAKRTPLPQPDSLREFPSPLPAYEPGVLDTVAAASGKTTAQAGGKTQLYRLPSSWMSGPVAPNLDWAIQRPESVAAFNEDRLQRPHGSHSSRVLGTTVHALFERAARFLATGRSEADLRAALPGFRLQANALTRNEGLSQQEAASIANSAVQALDRALADPTGLWILGSHRESQTESSWTAVIDGVPSTLRIDRSFFAGPEPLLPKSSLPESPLDGENWLWIIDYKTATHGSSGIDQFLAAERLQYAAQLESYAERLKLAHGSDIQVRLGLYYPFLSKLLWWAAYVNPPPA
jgi:ATP-dependent helicase/nuclease subunit A